MTSTAAAALAPHVVLLPLPAQGHINPFTSLARFLSTAGISVTLLHTRLTHSLLSSSTAGSDACALDMPIRIQTLPDVCKPTQRFSIDALTAAVPAMSAGLAEVLQKLLQEDNPPCCLIHDALLPWCHDVAAKLGLPRVVMWTCSASVLAMGFHVQELIARGYIPAVDKASQAKTIDFIPGLSPFRVADLSESMRADQGLQTASFELLTSSIARLRSADRVLVNSMYELEKEVLDALQRTGGVPVDAVGPLFLSSIFMSASQSTENASLFQEDTSCLTWLDQQEESSVIYISFGSLAAVEEDLFEELAHGLEASRQRFLWVIRPDAHKRKEDITAKELLPIGFMERTSGRGLVVSWAPQLAVLAHPSVGAFLSHCGWNSVMESLSYGVPMVGYPQIAEQNTNLKLIVQDWKVGMPLVGEEGSRADRTKLQRVVSEVMEGSGEGMEVRRRAREWRDRAQKAMELHGSSNANLQKLVQDLRGGHFKAIPSSSLSS